jgi:hypothetical protein
MRPPPRSDSLLGMATEIGPDAADKLQEHLDKVYGILDDRDAKKDSATVWKLQTELAGLQVLTTRAVIELLRERKPNEG